MSHKVEIEFEPYQRLQAYTEVAKGEIGGLGRVTLNPKTNVFTITEVFLIEQDASPAECELSAEGIAKLYSELLDKGEDVDDIKLWWHSHAEMKSFFSATDTKTMNEWPGDWLVALVINKDDEISARFQIQKPLPLYVDLEPKVKLPAFQHMESVKAEVKDKVTLETLCVVHKPKNNTPKSSYQSGWGNYQRSMWWEDDGYDDTPLTKKPQHSMTDAEFREMEKDYGAISPLTGEDLEKYDQELDFYNIDTEWDEWADRFMEAELKDDDTERLRLIDEALEKGIIELDEIDMYLSK